MSNHIYLDNAATTRVCDAAVDAAIDAMRHNYGNPSSLHSLGFDAERIIEGARHTVADAMGLPRAAAPRRDIIFTSGGTEANNLAIYGAAAAAGPRKRHILSCAAEHASVLEPLERLAGSGYEVELIAPDRDGRLDISAFAARIRGDTALISLMLVNNETGVVNDIAPLRRARTAAGSSAVIHSDAVQALGHVPLDVGSQGVDLLTVSGHKINAPKGIGALYIKNGVRVNPLLYGGGQQYGLRPGTQPVSGIAALAAAAEQAAMQLHERIGLLRALNARARRELSGIPGLAFISPEEQCAPHILTVGLPGYKGETIVHFLAERGIYVSSGSACSRGARSHVLASMGLSDACIDGAVRIGFSYENTADDIVAMAAGLRDAAARLARR